MKGILVTVLVLFISACASQPEKSSASASDRATEVSSSSAAAANSQSDQPYEVVYLDDYERVHVKVAHPKRPVVILGGQ